MYLHFDLLSGQWWLLTLNHSDDIDILQKDRSKTLIPARKKDLKHCSPLYMKSPPPAGFHDKTKTTQQGNLLPILKGLED